MQIKRLVLATACTLSYGLTQAAGLKVDTTVYGVISIDALSASDVYNSTADKSLSKFLVDNGAQTSSRLGFKATHKIKPDLDVNFGIEAGFRSDTGETSSGQLFNRGTYLGLSGKFGEIKAGRQWNLNDDVMCGYIVCGGYAMFRFSEFGDVSNLYNNSLKYWSPSLGGLKLGAMFGAGESSSSSDGSNMGEFVANYDKGNFSSALGFHVSKDTAGDRSNILKTAGVSYKLGPVRPRLGYAVAHYPSLSSNAESYDIGLDWTVTQPLTVSFDYVSRNKKDSPDDTKYYRMRAIYAVDADFSLNANIVFLNNDEQAKERFYGDGRPGQVQRVYSIGMQYSF